MRDSEPPSPSSPGPAFGLSSLRSSSLLRCGSDASSRVGKEGLSVVGVVGQVSGSDDRSESVENDPPEDGLVPAKTIPVASFEGEFVRKMVAKLPAMTLEMEEGFARNTHLRMVVEFRVKGVAVREGAGKDKELFREHDLVLEDIQLVSAFAPETRRDDIAGDATGQARPTAEESEELGVQFGRTSDHWPPTGTE